MKVTIILVLLCFAECGRGQRVFWLLVRPPQHARIFHGGGGQDPNQVDSSEEFGGNSVLSDDPSYIDIYDPTHHQAYYQRPTFYTPPSIAPLFISEYGSGSWPERKKTSAEYMYNSGVLATVGKEEEDSGSSGSGSTEQKLSVVHHSSKLNLLHEDASTGGAVVVKQVNRCLLEGNQARFDPVTGSCHTIGTKGPCGDLMIFTTMPNDNFNGYCDCDYDSFDRPMVYLGGQCQILYTQALCYPGYWLTSSTPDSEPICQLNPCYSVSAENSIPTSSRENSFVLFKGECIKLHSASRHCRREGEVVLFPKGSSEPACGFPKSTRRIYRRQISNINRFTCGPGLKRHRITKKCIRQRAIFFG